MEAIERVEEQDQTAEVFENDIDMYLHLFCEEQKIEDIKKESQNVWNGCLLYINRHVFKGTDKLKTNKYIFNNNIPSNCNAYDMDIINNICDYYIYLCYQYDKEVSVMGFCKLTGISQDCMYEWAKDDRKLSSAGCELHKKLVEERQESLSAKLVTGRQNPVGVLGVLNRHYQWNMPGVSREQAKITQRTPEEIAAGYGQARIEGKMELPEVPE